MSNLKVTELAIYPVKSCSQISVNFSKIDRFGLLNDRRWMVIDAQGKFVTQRQQSKMSKILITLFDNGIKLSAIDMPDIEVVKPTQLESVKVAIWGDQCDVIECGTKVSRWLTHYLSMNCRLVYFPDSAVRFVDPDYAHLSEQTAFSDGFPVLIISQASLDDLNNKLDVAITMNRFRPNIVVSGCEAFAEDKWQTIRIENCEFQIVKACSRCVIPSIDPATGERGVEPLIALKKYRKRDDKIYFGQNMLISGVSGSIAVGARVEIVL